MSDTPPTPPERIPSDAEIERAVRTIVERMLPRLHRIAERKHGTVSVTLVDGRPVIKEIETPAPDDDIYAGPDL